MAQYLIQDTTLQGIADAIREKTGGTSSIKPSEMAEKIGDIEGGESKTAELWFDYLTVSGWVIYIDKNGNLIYDNLKVTDTIVRMQIQIPQIVIFDAGFFTNYTYTGSGITEIPPSYLPSTNPSNYARAFFVNSNFYIHAKSAEDGGVT